MTRRPPPVALVTGILVAGLLAVVVAGWLVGERPAPAVASTTADCIEPAVLQTTADVDLEIGPDGSAFFVTGDGSAAEPLHGLDVSPICSL